MRELLRTNDLVLISWLTAVLGEVGIEIVVFDAHTSILEGSANAIQRRVVVIDEDHDEAKQTFLKAEAEIGGDAGTYEFPE